MFEFRKYHFKPLHLAFLILAASGCASTLKGPTLVVGNATGELISRAVLITQTGQSYSFTDIVPFSVSGGVLRTNSLSPDLRMEWHSSPGGSNSAVLKLSEDILDFKGWIQFQIDSAGAVKVFTAPMEDSGNSALPWSMPASWEGAPSIPGMNM